MAAKVTFKLEGAAELRKRLHEFGPRFVTNTSGRALRAGAKPILALAKQPRSGARGVPVLTGALRKSITTRLRRAKFGLRTIELGFKPPTSRRAHLTEFGTARSSAQPFMRPALDEGSSAAFTEMQLVLSVAIETEALSRGLGSSASEIGE